MDKYRMEILSTARNILVKLGGNDYHKGCELLSDPKAPQWGAIDIHCNYYNYSLDSKIELKKEVMRLVKGWSAIYKPKRAELGGN